MNNVDELIPQNIDCDSVARDPRAWELFTCLEDPALFAEYWSSETAKERCTSCEDNPDCSVEKGAVGCRTCSVYHEQVSCCSHIYHFREWILNTKYQLDFSDAYYFIQKVERFEETNTVIGWPRTFPGAFPRLLDLNAL